MCPAAVPEEASKRELPAEEASKREPPEQRRMLRLSGEGYWVSGLGFRVWGLDLRI